jgi:hypothetical protein
MAKSGQHDVLEAALAWQTRKLEQVASKAREAGIDIFLDDDEPEDS